MDFSLHSVKKTILKTDSVPIRIYFSAAAAPCNENCRPRPVKVSYSAFFYV